RRRPAARHADGKRSGAAAPAATPAEQTRLNQSGASTARRDAGACQHPPKVNDRLLVDVLVLRRIEDLGLVTERHVETAVVLFRHRPDGLEQRPNLPPL